MDAPQPTLLVVAHGTASSAGAVTITRLVGAIAAARPAVDVQLCFLDVVEPRLDATLARLDRPAVVLPLLLSIGYHVQTDIPAAVSARPDPAIGVTVARHLGPHPLLVDALVDRLAEVTSPDTPAASTVLVGAGSRSPAARDELGVTATMLAARLDRPVDVLTMADDLTAAVAKRPRPVHAATYLLAEGQFVTTLRSAAGDDDRVAEPLGRHPAVVRLAWLRYDDAVEAVR